MSIVISFPLSKEKGNG